MNDEEDKGRHTGAREANPPLKEKENAAVSEAAQVEPELVPEPGPAGPEAAVQPADTQQQPAEQAAVSVEALEARHRDNVGELKEKMLRIAADFDNYKKRIQRELRDREERTKSDVVKTLLPTIDNFQRAASHLKDCSDVTTILEGIGIVEKNFLDTMARLGVRRFESVGQVFDPTLHEAVMQQESEEFPAGTIVAEVQAGYMMGDKLLRAALVVVSSGKPKPRETAAKDGGPGKNAAPEGTSGDGSGSGPMQA